MKSNEKKRLFSASENMKWRIRKGFENGELMNLRRMLGYDIRKGEIAVNEEQARAVDVAIRAIRGATCSAIPHSEAVMLLNARRTLERMLAEGFRPCENCRRLPTPFPMLGDDGWCAVCHCPSHVAYGRSLDEVREAWNEEAGQE